MHITKSTYLPPNSITLILLNYKTLILPLYTHSTFPFQKQLFPSFETLILDITEFIQANLNLFLNSFTNIHNLSQNTLQKQLQTQNLQKHEYYNMGIEIDKSEFFNELCMCFINKIKHFQILIGEAVYILHIQLLNDTVQPSLVLDKIIQFLFKIYMQVCARVVGFCKESEEKGKEGGNVDSALFFGSVVCMGFVDQVISAYKRGLDLNLKMKRSCVFIPEVIFAQGKDVIQATLSLEYMKGVNMKHLHFVKGISNTQLNRMFLSHKWSIIASYLRIMNFDNRNTFFELKDEIIVNTINLLENSTPEFQRPLFSILNSIYVPISVNFINYQCQSKIKF